jgi:hypothetical protein
MYFYAGSTNCFYTAGSDTPSDALEITDERYQELLAGMAEGKTILSKAGHPEFYVPTYSELRAAAYPPIVDQLDTIFHGGLDAWKAEIQAVKTQFPKEVA